MRKICHRPTSPQTPLLQLRGGGGGGVVLTTPDPGVGGVVIGGGVPTRLPKSVTATVAEKYLPQQYCIRVIFWHSCVTWQRVGVSLPYVFYIMSVHVIFVLETI